MDHTVQSMKPDKAILSMAIGQVFTWAGLYYIFPALLLRWEQDLGWSKAELTAAITLAVFASAVAAVPAGRMIDRGLGASLMAGSALLGSAALLACSFVQQYWQFLLLWSVIGISLAGCLYEPCFAIVTRARGPRAKQSIVLITLIAGFAGAVSFPSAHLLAETFDWRVTLRVSSLAVALIGAPLLWTGARMLESGADAARTKTPAATSAWTGSLLASPVFWLLGIGMALLAVVHGVTLHHLLPILNERGVHPEVAVFAASLIGPMQVAGRLVMVAANRHATNHGIAVATFVLMGLSILLLIGAGGTPVLLVTFVALFGGSYGIVSIIRPVIARDLLGQAGFGAKSGGLALLYLCGSASAPFVGALLWEFDGYGPVLQLLVGLSAVGLALYAAAHRIVAVTATGSS